MEYLSEKSQVEPVAANVWRIHTVQCIYLHTSGIRSYNVLAHDNFIRTRRIQYAMVEVVEVVVAVLHSPHSHIHTHSPVSQVMHYIQVNASPVAPPLNIYRGALANTHQSRPFIHPTTHSFIHSIAIADQRYSIMNAQFLISAEYNYYNERAYICTCMYIWWRWVAGSTIPWKALNTVRGAGVLLMVEYSGHFNNIWFCNRLNFGSRQSIN